MFTTIPIVKAGTIHVHADGIMLTAADSSVGMFVDFAQIDAAKIAADVERAQQVREGRVPAVTA